MLYSYLTLKEDILCQKEDGRAWPKKEDMSFQRRTYGNPTIVNIYLFFIERTWKTHGKMENSVKIFIFGKLI
jgi:hypothetical protein